MSKHPATATLLVALLLITAPAMAQLPSAVNGQPVPSLAPLVEQTAPAVVNIATRATVSAPNNPLMDDPFFRRFFGIPENGQMPRQREVRSAGSGVIIDAAKGYVITNHHVVAEADQIEVALVDGRTLEAEIVGSDEGTDIALLKLSETKDLTEMPIADSEDLEVGDFVVAIGNPFGLQHTVTSGIVSALGRTGISQDGYGNFIQTDASINPGNSGGGLINLSGELVGINTAIFSRSGGNIGIGFAIPTNIIESIMAQILEFGEVRRGLLGVSISDFTRETAEAFGIDADQGALVQEVMADSAAAKAGIEVGDVITEVDGEEIKGASDLRNRIGLKRSGETVDIEVLRDGRSRNISATLQSSAAPEEPEELDAAEVHPGLAGASFSDYTGNAEWRGKGVLVDSVAQGSPAALRGLQTGDIITAVNRRPVSSVGDLQDLAEGRDLLVMNLRRGGRSLLLQVR